MNRFVQPSVLRLAMLTIVAAFFGTQAAHAALIPTLPLPGGQVNLFAGGYANGSNGSWNGGFLNSAQTDGYVLDTTNSTYSNPGSVAANSTAFSPSLGVYADVFATPVASMTSAFPSQTTSTSFNDIRIYGQAATGNAIDNSYNEPPTSVNFKYNYINGNPLNVNGVGDPTHWGNLGTILAVNGVPVASPTAGNIVALTAAEWAHNGVVPGTGGTGTAGVYYIDLTVANSTNTGPVPATNSLQFNFGVSPDRAEGNGGLILSEIQAANISFAPEPGSCFLLLVAAGMLGLTLRRRRSSQQVLTA